MILQSKNLKVKGKKGGFTLIELLVVIAIIGILAGVILVSVNTARSKGINARILAQVSQMKTALEQDYVNAMYIDLLSTGTHTATFTATGSNVASLTLLACDIGQLLNYPTITNDLNLTCNGVAVDTGVIIYTTKTSATSTDYGIYATSTPSGYVCMDSFGNTVATTTGTIPATYAAITSPTSALCQ